MVKAAVNFRYGDKFFKEGDEIPDDLLKELEEQQPNVLNTYIEVNSKWIRIDSPLIEGFVKERKHLEKRLKDYFGIKKVESSIVEDKSHMLRSRPQRSDLEKQLIEKSQVLGFKKFREFAKIEYQVTGSSSESIIKDILSGKKEL